MTLFGFPCNYCNKLYDPNQDHQQQYAIEFLNDFIVEDWFNEIFIIDFQDYEIRDFMNFFYFYFWNIVEKLESINIIVLDFN